MGTHPIFESDFDCLTEMDVFVIIGGTRGLGRACAEYISKTNQESAAIITGRRPEAPEDSLVGPKVTYAQFDSSHYNETDLFQKIESLGKIKNLYFIFSAFELGFGDAVADLDLAKIDKYYKDNVTSLVFVIQNVMKLAYENLAICNVSSHYGYRLGDAGFSTANWSLQCAGKSSREIFLQCAFNESKDKGVPFGYLSFIPGVMQTDMLTESQNKGGTSKDIKARDPSDVACIMIDELLKIKAGEMILTDIVKY